MMSSSNGIIFRVTGPLWRFNIENNIVVETLITLSQRTHTNRLLGLLSPYLSIHVEDSATNSRRIIDHIISGRGKVDLEPATKWPPLGRLYVQKHFKNCNILFYWNFTELWTVRHNCFNQWISIVNDDKGITRNSNDRARWRLCAPPRLKGLILVKPRKAIFHAHGLLYYASCGSTIWWCIRLLSARLRYLHGNKNARRVRFFLVVAYISS